MLELEYKKNPETKFESDLKKKREILEKEISSINEQTSKKIDGLNEEILSLKKNAEKLKKTVSSLEDSISQIKQKLEDQQNRKSDLDVEIRDFHTNYIIKAFGKKYGVSSMAANKKKLIIAESSAIASLKKELSTVEKEIKAFEKADKKRKQELQKKLARQEKEKEQVRKEQEERQLRVKKELQAKEKEQKIIKGRSVNFDIAGLMNELGNEPNNSLLSPYANPFEEDDKKTITNSIVRKRFVQKKATPECNEYLLFFVDDTGDLISDQRLVRQMQIGEKTTVSFELKSSNGFNKNDYYLIVLNFNTGETISVTRYKINISFSNDFDF